MRLPDCFIEEMKALLGRDYEEYEKSLEKKSVSGLRVNTAKISPEDFRKLTPFSLTPVPWTTNGFYYRDEDAPAKHPHYHAGLYYIQEPSAMVPASRLPVEKGERVLDLCAAPGGKATELGARLAGEGLLVANDISHSRAKSLLKNLEMAGHKNILVTSEPPEKLLQYFPGFFDKILVDAPCSGEGMFRRDPAMIKSYEEKGPEYYVPLQRSILKAAVGMLKPGGMLLYSTCTFSKSENEDNICYLLDEEPGMSLVQAKSCEGFARGFAGSSGNMETEKCIRLFPHLTEGEGHFAALLKKDGGAGREDAALQDHRAVNELLKKGAGNHNAGNKNAEKSRAVKGNKFSASFLEFAEQIPWLDPRKDWIEVREDSLYLMPEALRDVSLRGLRFLRTGLLIGMQKKERFEPSQALAAALRMDEYENHISYPSDSVEAVKYLKGETLSLPGAGKGWVMAGTDGYPLGWAKAAGNSLKNKYYPGWRMQ